MPKHHIKFGTSGLRGHAAGFTSETVSAYVDAFLSMTCAGAREKAVWVGNDLRASSPAITRRVIAAIAAKGWSPHYAGIVPTPALAGLAMREGVPAIMVTGSHIPAEFNGLKFYRPDGELLKADETPIRAAAESASPKMSYGTIPELPPPDPMVAADYKKRYLTAFPTDALRNLRIGIFEHSAAGRDLLSEILQALGAECIRFGRSEAFVAVDTEAISPKHMDQMSASIRRHNLDAVVSTDGDGDRPLMLDERGRQINGDVLGALTARALGAQTVVTPLTSTSAIEMSGWFDKVHRTRVGSPYVIEAMAGESQSVVGFEANGGFMVQTSFSLPHGRLDPLPTRDALLPIITVLATVSAGRLPLSSRLADLPKRYTRAGRMKDVSPERGTAFVATMAIDSDQRAAIDPILAELDSVDTSDGTRLVLSDGSIVHFRQSGNAPELRCYVESDDLTATNRLLGILMDRMAHFLEQRDH